MTWATALILSVVWLGLTASFSPANIVLALIIGGVTSQLVKRVAPERKVRGRWPGRILALLGFAGFYLKELFVANLRVAADVVTPRLRARPAIVAIPIEPMSDLELVILSNLLTMTPGSLTLHVSDDRRTLYVHIMYLDDPDHVRRHIRDNYQGRVLRILR